MTDTGVSAVLAKAEIIGDNIFNFMPKFKEYENIFTKKTREEIIEMKRPELVKLFDEYNLAKTWKDISAIFTSSHVIYSIHRYDITHGKVEDGNLVLTDMDTGDVHYIACDQINTIVRYPKSVKLNKVDPKTGEIKEFDINENQIRIDEFYRG